VDTATGIRSATPGAVKTMLHEAGDQSQPTHHPRHIQRQKMELVIAGKSESWNLAPA